MAYILQITIWNEFPWIKSISLKYIPGWPVYKKLVYPKKNQWDLKHTFRLSIQEKAFENVFYNPLIMFREAYVNA